MKTTYFLFFSLISLCTVAQTDSYSFIPKDLHYIPTNELKEILNKEGKLDLLNVQYFDKEGKPLDKNYAIMKLQDNTHTFVDYFANNNSEIKIMLLRPTTPEESMAAIFDTTPHKSLFIPIPSPNFSIKLVNDETFSFDSLKHNELLVLNFWFTHCGPCKDEMPALNKLVEKYKEQNIKFLSMTFDDKNDVKKFLKSTKFNYKMGLAGEEIIEKFAVSVFPTNMIIDKKGMIVFREKGGMEGIVDLLDKAIEKHLKE